MADRSAGRPGPGGYWLSPRRMAATAASATSAGPSVSGNPCPRLTDPVATASAVISAKIVVANGASRPPAEVADMAAIVPGARLPLVGPPRLGTTRRGGPIVGAAVHDPDPHRSPSFSVATFNAHAGTDGWGRPYDVVAACRAIDADVLVLEENWAPDDGPSLAGLVAAALGYEAREHALAGGRLALPHPDADARWMRSFDWRGRSHAIFLDSERPFGPRVLRSRRFVDARPGRWGLAVLSRLPVTDTRVIELGRLARDRARRAALVVTVDAGLPVTVIGTHMSHI